MDETLLLLRHLADHVRQQDDPATAARIGEQAQDVRQRSQLVRQALMQREIPGQES